MSSVWGSTKSSNVGAYGSGTSCAVTRMIGPSSHANACSLMRAAISPATPPVRVSSCTMSTLFVFCTVRMIAASSIGSRVRRSSTSTDRPSSFASWSAASSDFHTVAPYVTMERSFPSLALRQRFLDPAVQPLVLEVDDGILIPDRRLDQPLGVTCRGGIHNLQTRRMKEGRLRVLRMERTAAHVPAARPAHHHRGGQPRAVACRCNVIRKHVVRAG